MSKKDYVMLAEALNKARRDVDANPRADAGTILTVAVNKIAEGLAADSPRFDRERFMRAALEGDFKAPKRVRAPRGPRYGERASCDRCSLEIEYQGDGLWNDRGNEVHCHSGENVGSKHVPVRA